MEDKASPFGPDLLSDRLIAELARVPAVKSGLTSDAIRRLVRVTYEASLLPEEGRFPTFRLVMGGKGFGSYVSLAPSSAGVLVDNAEALRRLAPVLSGQRVAALVQPNSAGELRISRAVDFEEFCTNPLGSIHRLSDQPYLPDGILFLRVDGPGNIRAHLHPGTSLHLRAGEVRSLRSFVPVIPPFTALLSDLCEPLYDSLKDQKHVRNHAVNHYILMETLAELWAYSLAVAVGGRHGGAFALVPEAGLDCLSVKYEADFDIFAAFAGLLRETATYTDGAAHYEFKNYWRSKQPHLRSLCKLVGHLSHVDGCVVLDHKLRVTGFGAKIEWPDRAEYPPLLDAQTGKEVPESTIRQELGTRHRSACRLAQNVPGAIVFVISQDGDLTAFHGEETQAYRSKDLDAWPSVVESL